MEVIRIKKILVWNWPIGICLHCVRTLSWFVLTMSTLLPILRLLTQSLAENWSLNQKLLDYEMEVSKSNQNCRHSRTLEFFYNLNCITQSIFVSLKVCVLLSFRYDPSAPQAWKNFVRLTQMKINNVYGQNAP